MSAETPLKRMTPLTEAMKMPEARLRTRIAEFLHMFALGFIPSPAFFVRGNPIIAKLGDNSEGANTELVPRLFGRRVSIDTGSGGEPVKATTRDVLHTYRWGPDTRGNKILVERRRVGNLPEVPKM